MSTLQIVIFVTLFVVLTLLILFYDRIRQSKLFKKDEYKQAKRAALKAAKEEEYFRRVSTKHYHEGDKVEFEKDYFKSKEEDAEKQAAEQQEKTTRRTTSSDGVTIIDERQPTEAAPKEKKIFEDGEGEYVEFTEVDN